MSKQVKAVRQAVKGKSGVARVSTLIREGHSRYWITRALEDGEIVRVRRDWVALPGANAELVTAARHAVVLSCITQARRLGLWVLRETLPHYGADPHGACGKPEKAVVHWGIPLQPRSPDVLEDPIENVLGTVASCQPFEVALAIWDSALNKRLVRLDALQKLELPNKALRVLAQATPYSDSGLETMFRTRLRWLKVPILSQIWLAGHRVDFLLGERLVVQIDGGHHVGEQRSSDVAHDAYLAALGYHVLRFSYAQIVDDWPMVQTTIMQALAAGLHRAA